MKNVIQMTCLAAVVAALGSAAMADSFGTGGDAFDIDFVPISGSTNPTAAQTTVGDLDGFGIVNNDYRMGVYEITNDQWDKFKAAYGPVTGSPASAYAADPSHTGTNVPTNQVSWYEAAQMVNWLNTSTGHQAAYKFTGTQGTDDYRFAVWDAVDAAGEANLYRHKDAFYYLPTEDEWFKAAYWNGATIQTYSNAVPGDLVSGEPDPAKWNYQPSVGWAPWNVGSGIEELNGTYDMMGNILEWIESPHNDPNYGTGSAREQRAGAFGSAVGSLASSSRGGNYPYLEFHTIGFRVASVPEPCSLGLLALGGLALIKRRRR